MINTGKTYDSLAEVLELLGSSYIKEGEEVILRYRTGPDSIDALVAVGTKTGIGPGCFSILGTSGVQIVIFVSDLPDASNLKNGQLYIWTESPDGIIYKIYLNETIRVAEPVTTEMFVQDENGVKYYINSTSVKRFSDLMTVSEYDEKGKIRFLTQSEYDELPEKTKSLPDNVFVICSKQ